MRFSPRRHFLSTAAAPIKTSSTSAHRSSSPTKRAFDQKLGNKADIESKMDQLGTWLHKLTLSDAISADIQGITHLLQHSEAHALLKLFSPDSITTLYRLLSKFNCLDLLNQIRTSMKDIGVNPTMTDYQVWLVAYTKSNLLQEAQKLISDAQIHGFQLSWSHALMDCIESGDLQSAHQTIKILADIPTIQVEASAYKTLIQAFLRNDKRKDIGSLGYAISTFQLMVQSNTEADGETYSAFVEAYIEDSLANWKDNEHKTRISTIDRLYEAILAQPNFEPPSSVWTSLIRVYTQNDSLAKAEQVYYDYKKTEKIAVDVMNTTENLIVALSRQQWMVSANSLFYDLMADGHLFHHKTLSAMVYGYGSKNDLEAAEQLILTSREQWAKPNLQPYAALIREHMRLNDIQSARRIFDTIADNIPRSHPSFQVYVYNLLLTGYANAGNIKQCETLWRHMKHHDIISFNVMLEAYSEVGAWDGFMRTLDKMHQDHVKPDSRTKSILIFGQIRQGHLDRAQDMVKTYASAETFQLKACNLIGAVNSLLQLQSLKGDKEACEQLFQYLVKYDRANANSYQSILFCLGKIGATNELKTLYEKARKLNIQLEPAIDRLIRQWL
jgi:pentatricopeptide repeat protein